MSSTHLATLLAVVAASTLLLDRQVACQNGKSHPILHVHYDDGREARSIERRKPDLHISFPPATASISKEDFAFATPADADEDLQVDLTSVADEDDKNQVKQQRPLPRPPLDASKWGPNLRDVFRNDLRSRQLIATVGKVFHLKLQRDGVTDSYDAKRIGGGLIPSWLLLHRNQGEFWGVPLSRDIGQLNISAGGQNRQHYAYQITILPTLEDSRTRANGHMCASHKDKMILSFLLDREVDSIKPKQRVMMISNLAKFLGLPYTTFTLQPLFHPDNLDSPNVIMAGPGHLSQRNMRPLAQIVTLVGCDRRHLWPHTAPLVHQLKQQVREGTVAEVVGAPVIGWRVRVADEDRRTARKRRTGDVRGRKRRQTDDFGGSGDYGDYTYDDDYNYDDEYDDDYTEDKKPVDPGFQPPAPPVKLTTTTKRPTPSKTKTTTTTTTTSTPRPRPTTTSTTSTTTTTTPSTTTTLSTTTSSTTTTTTTTTIPPPRNTTAAVEQVAVSATMVPSASEPTHPHRHHHGETKVTPSVQAEDIDTKINELEPKVWQVGTDDEDDDEEDSGVSESKAKTALDIPTETGRSTGGSTLSTIVVDDGDEDEGVIIDEAIELPKVEDPLNAINYDDDDIEEYYDETESETPSIVAKGTIAPVEPEIVSVTSAVPTVKTTTELVINPPTSSTSSTTSITPALTSSTTTEAITKTSTAATLDNTIVPSYSVTTSSSNFNLSTVTSSTEPSTITTSTVVSTTTREHQSTMPETDSPTFGVTDESTVTETSFGSTMPISLNITSTSTSTEKPTTMEDASTTVKQTTIRQIASSTLPTTENVFYETKNFPPIVQNRLKRLATTAGKLFSFVIPADTFYDFEDGADGLRYEFLDAEEHPVKKDSWCQFNALRREVYGLPLEEDVSRWLFTLRAVDSAGASCSSTLEILVQQHKLRRVVNHEFTLHLHVEKKWEFDKRVDWPVRVLHGLGELYYGEIGGKVGGGKIATEVTVRKVDWGGTEGKDVDGVELTWTNDTLPKAYCPREEIEQIFNMMTANNEGDPSHAITRALIPQLRVKKVTQEGLGVCEPQKPVQPPQPPLTPPTNFSPILRNPVDHINATVGELLVFKVPDDTFYDPEDVDSRTLKMSLLTVDREQIPTDHWLQFDGKNREFYGIPLVQDVGRSEYQLICEDSGGLPASDSLVVQVHAPTRQQYPVEFSATVAMDYEAFVTSATLQRKFVEKIRDLFNDQTTASIHLSSISRGSTIISWYNKTLATSPCPREEIHRLESMLVNNDRTISTRVQDIMDPEFQIASIKLQLIGACKGRPSIQSPSGKGIPMEDLPPPPSTHEDYLVTFIVPAVIIAAMLFLAGIAACVLYRRRRTGKMAVGGVGDEDGRGAYGNKGIPVIFQEELEEKPESGTKAPIILADEKPPLAPPEYSKSGSLLKLPSATNTLNKSHSSNNSHNAQHSSPYSNALNNANAANDNTEPYQPPPPFTRPTNPPQAHARNHDGPSANGRQSGRGKATPTYRKPPPYVPP